MCHTGSGRNCNTVLILLVSCQQTCMTHTIALCKVKNYDGQRNCSKYVEFYSKNKFEKLVDLVRFIIRNPPPIFHLVPNLVQYFHFAGYKHNRGFYFNTVINYNVQWSQTNIETGNTIFSLIQQSELSVRWPNVQVSGSHIIRHTHTHGRTLLNEWSADLRDRYIHKTHRAQKTKFHASSGIRSRDSSNRDATDLSLRQHDHQDRRTRQHAIKI